VVSYKEYPQEETDFIKYVQDMVGLGNPGKHRKLEVAKLNEYLKEQKAKTGKDSKSKLQSVIQFDALFIPDGPKAVAQIAPALAYFDVNLPLLGTTEWNSDQFYQRGGKYVEGAIFPAGLHLNSSQPRTQLFIRTYQQAFGISPDLLSAQAFEAMDVLIHSIKSSGTSDRNQLVNSMSQLKGYESPLGSLSFDNHRLARRSISILSLEQGGRVTEHF
jgi:branched-chain amino acid transport system substrate-binding protein